jgi:N-acetylglucosaminyl-diphospho-decaprenol L-rhamnosyltransferase
MGDPVTDENAGPTVLTVLLNWRTAEMTIRAALAAERAMEGISGAITVVDNASGDGSFEAMQTALAGHPRITVVLSDRNGGFGAGNNVGIRRGLPGGARPDFVYIQNSDAFPAPDAIRKLRDYLMTHPEAGFAGSYIHGSDGVPHVTCFRFPSIASEFEAAAKTGPITRLLGHRKVPVGVPQASGPVAWLAGASLMMREGAVQHVGLFDENFFLYFEETDLCRRAAAAGWQTHFVLESRVEHIGSVSTGMKTWARVPGYWFDSRWRYFRKAGGTGHAILATLVHLCGSVIHHARCLVSRKTSSEPPHFLRDLVGHALRQVFGGNKPSRHWDGTPPI